MERERKFNILRGIVSGAFLTMETKQELIDFVNELEETEQEIRNKAIDEFVEKLKDSLAHNYRHLLNVDTDGYEWLTTDAVRTHIDEIAEKMKGGTE